MSIFLHAGQLPVLAQHPDEVAAEGLTTGAAQTFGIESGRDLRVHFVSAIEFTHALLQALELRMLGIGLHIA